MRSLRFSLRFSSPVHCAAAVTCAVGLAVATLATLPQAVHAQSIVYTDSSSFVDNVAPGYYTEGFDTGVRRSQTSFSFNKNGYAYTVMASGGTKVAESGSVISTEQSAKSLTFSFTSNNVSAIGGSFFQADDTETFFARPVTINLSDGTSTTFTPTSQADSFRGFTASGNTLITSLTLAAPANGLYAMVDDFIVGTRATTSIYTDSATFLSQVRSGYYTEGFNTGFAQSQRSFSFNKNGYAYTVTASEGAVPVRENGSLITTDRPARSLTFTFSSGNVSAIGGNFFQTNSGDVFQSQPVTINLSNGTTTTFTPTSQADAFRGFIAPGNSVITSLTLAAPTGMLFSSADDFIVGSRITPADTPEPSTLPLLGMGLVMGLGAARKVSRRRT